MNTIEIIENIFNDLSEKYELNFNNGYVSVYDNHVMWIIEAPNNTTLQIDFVGYKLTEFIEFVENKNVQEIEGIIYAEIENAIDNFDPDEVFEELWCPQFSKKNNFKPSQFIRMLEDDCDYFYQVKNKMLHDANIIDFEF